MLQLNRCHTQFEGVLRIGKAGKIIQCTLIFGIVKVVPVIGIEGSGNREIAFFGTVLSHNQGVHK
jgi:hypothetical protein